MPGPVSLCSRHSTSHHNYMWPIRRSPPSMKSWCIVNSTGISRPRLLLCFTTFTNRLQQNPQRCLACIRNERRKQSTTMTFASYPLSILPFAFQFTPNSLGSHFFHTNPPFLPHKPSISHWQQGRMVKNASVEQHNAAKTEWMPR